MNIVSSKFEISNSDVSKCPSGCRHEYAFIGRSNVGKSSLINMLTNHKGLAMTSSTPGKTTLVKHFLINNEWYIVDLPGYGYAQRGKEMQRKIRKIIEDYILERGQMTNLFLLVDSRHEPQKIVLESGDSNREISRCTQRTVGGTASRILYVKFRRTRTRRTLRLYRGT